VGCETDFVAKNEDFQDFARNIAMHIAATNPLGIRSEEIPQEIIDKEMEIYMAQAKETGKPDNILEKIAQGKLQKFIKENSLMDQPYVRNPDMTVADLLNELIAKIGENITVKRFTRFQVGEA
jgi:elongation factor Ts